MTDSNQGKPNQKHLIPYVEKPLIRIEADKELFIMDDYILKQTGRLHARDFEMDFKDALKDLSDDLKEKFREVFKESYEQDNEEFLVKYDYNHLKDGVLPEGEEFTSLGELKKEYLRVKGFEFATPGFGIIPRFNGHDHRTYVEGVVLTYRSERDLTLNQLNDLFTAIVQKLENIVADLGLEMSVIRKITVQSYHEPGIVFDVFDEILDLIEYIGGHLAYPKSDHAITEELETTGTNEKIRRRLSPESDSKYQSEPVGEIMYLLAEKLDKFHNLLRGKNRRY